MTDDLLVWTTEKQTEECETDSKVFLNEEQMAKKILNWDFLYCSWVTGTWPAWEIND